MGECAWRYAGFLNIFLALRRFDPKNEALLEAVVKQARTTKHPWLTACDANMSPKKADVHRGANGIIDMQIKRPKR